VSGPPTTSSDEEHAGLVARSVAPDRARISLARILDAQAGPVRALDDPAADALVLVATASRSLARLLEADPTAIAVLGDLDRHVAPPPGGVDELVAWKHREYLRIAARDLVGVDRLEETGALLAALARDVLRACCELAGAEGLAVIGMGKLGGNELNYSSDIDLVFVAEGTDDHHERDAQHVMALAGRCFRVDANLRPEGRDGKLVRTLDSYEAYWDRWAQPWEFQALLKARPAAGDGVLGRRFLDAAQRWLWSRPFGVDDLRQLRDLKQRAERDVARRGLAGREVKRGPGGIRDVEFAAQILQLVHGHADPALRSPTTLEVLAELSRAGYIADDDATSLAESYRFLREVEHRLQLVEEQQVHTVPTDDEARDHLARVLGFRPTPGSGALEQFDLELRRVQNQVRSIHERLYFRPLLEAFAGSEGEMSPEVAATRLAAFGFTDAQRTKAAVRELTRGLNRSSRLMKQLLPLLLDWLSAAPDPDLGLLVLRNLLTGPQRRAQLVEAFRDSPEVARTLCLLVGTSRVTGDILIHNPDLVARLPHPDRLQTRPRDDLVESASTAVLWRQDDDRQEALRRWKERHLLGIQARDVLYDEPVEVVGRDLSALAEAALETMLAGMPRPVPFAVIALGTFGGASLSYGSDLDVVFVYDGDGPEAFEEADRLAKSVLHFSMGLAPADRIFEIDAQLRPEGNQGAMARSLEGYRLYFERWAQLWERQAYLRARPVAGDGDLGRRFIELTEPFVWGTGLSADEVREIRRMKARVEQERLPVGEDARFHLKLGRGSRTDIEWTAQLLQLTHGIRATGTVEALTAVRDAGHLAEDDADLLVTTYELLERTRNRLYLVSSTPSDSLPTQPEALMWLARSLGTNAADLREEYRRVTRRTRRVVERVFYGRD
jgi:glutamate-ammonia-ligase adenylyltransferase